MAMICFEQGILASFFYKFADTILKKYSSTIATIVTAILSYYMFGHQLSINFVIGVSIVLISMHQVSCTVPSSYLWQ
jgi:drug/metabolite transporter (DMT)-like permease